MTPTRRRRRRRTTTTRKKMFEKKKRNVVRGQFDRLATATKSNRSARHILSLHLSSLTNTFQNFNKYLRKLHS